MNSDTTTQLIQMLVYILIPIVIAVFGLIGFLVYLFFKEKSQKNSEKTNITTKSSTSSNTTNKQSIFNFMEFDTVTDNMIVQKNGSRYLMVVECQGINYDLMSGIEKTSVEEGFVQFLNTLRYPIQIYIQTRSINLESSLVVYREKVKEVEMKLNNMQARYTQMRESGEYSQEQLKQAFYELTKQSNLYEYGKSVLQDTERMSLNKNILNKKYYIIIPFFSAEASGENLDKKEIEENAFSELYTRAQSLINAISVCGVRGKILKSNELVELLYMAYNRDEAETFGLDKAMKAGYDEMYSTAPNVLNKKMKEIDKMIEEKAMDLANAKVEQAKTELEKQIEERENNMDDLISQMAKIIIEENEQYIGKELKDKAIEKVDEDSTNEGGKADGKKKTTRGRKKSTV
ncbi:MAG: hypothetical protein BHW02_03860 [Clostridium sp. 28_12]|nr:MAG: hypothetical protein BHW02_03860 [Clostridium sp. 28_12]